MIKTKILYFSMDTVDYGKHSRSHECYIAEMFAKMGHEVIMAVERMPHFKEGEKPANLHIEVIPVNLPYMSYEDMEKILKYDFDIVFASSVSSIYHVIYFSKLRNVKSIVQVLDVPIWRLNPDPVYPKHWAEQWKWWVERLEKVDIVIVNLEITKQLLNQMSANRLNDKMKIVYYGISSYEADKVPEQPKEDFLIWVSGIRFYKGLDILIFALACMPPEKRLPLYVVGVGDGAENYTTTNKGIIPLRYINLATLTGVDVRFLGGIDDDEKFMLMKKAKLSVMPDISMSIVSMFCIESIYCGVPCITVDLPVSRDRYGDLPIYVKDIFNTKAWAEKIGEVLDNIDKYTQEAKSKKEWIIQNRSFMSHAIKLLEIFEEEKNGT